MSAETTRTIAGILAQRLGIEPGMIEGSLADQPLAAAMTLALLGQPQPQTCDPAETVRFVATLVGACPVCLGEDRVCLECRGRGVPGSRKPDAAALVAWIEPPLRRLGLCVGKPRREPTTDKHEGGYES